MMNHLHTLEAAISGALSEALRGESMPDVTDEDITRAIGHALPIYSTDRPQRLVQDVVGDGSSVYSIGDHLTGYIDGFSVIDRIYYPITQATIRPPILQRDYYEVQRRPDGLYLVFYNVRPSSSSFRAIYTALHDPDLSTVPATDHIALQHLSLSFVLDSVANAKASEIAPSIDADTFDRSSQARHYRDAAKMYRTLYRELIGVDEGGDEGGRSEAPAGTQKSFSRQRRYHRPPLTH